MVLADWWGRCVCVCICVHVYAYSMCVGGIWRATPESCDVFLHCTAVFAINIHVHTLQYIEMALCLTPINSTPLPLLLSHTLSDIPLTHNCGSPPPIPRFNPHLSQMGHQSPLTHALSVSTDLPDGVSSSLTLHSKHRFMHADTVTALPTAALEPFFSEAMWVTI